jgi:hypothetical protein
MAFDHCIQPDLTAIVDQKTKGYELYPRLSSDFPKRIRTQRRNLNKSANR